MMSSELNPRTSSPRIGYLVVGLVFLGLSGTWLLNETDVIDPGGFQWLLPAILLGAGLVGLFGSLGKGIAGHRAKPYDEPRPHHTENQNTKTQDTETQS